MAGVSDVDAQGVGGLWLQTSAALTISQLKSSDHLFFFRVPLLIV